MNFNFFDWIRTGVKQSVILGVSDAVDRLGTPKENDDVSQRLLGFLQEDKPAAGRKRIAAGAGPKPRKLGRTMTQIQAESAKAS